MGIRMSEIIVFRLETCPNCDRLEELLRENGIEFREVDLQDTRHPDMITMRMHGIFPQEAPVIRVNSCYAQSKTIFDGNELSGTVKAMLGIE
jgi:glutaredoxin